MCNLVVSVFVFNPFKHFSASVVIKVGVNIRQRNTVWIKETLKKEVVFDWVYLCDSQAICHYRTCCRATTGTHHHAQLVACGVDEVLHDEEVAGKSHGLHDVKFKLHAFMHIFRQRVAI